MEEEPVHVIRECTRNLLKLNRQQQRDEVSDINRSISEISITPQTITNIALKLRTKSSIKASELQTLKNALMDDPNSKTIVLSTHGALRGLVRELTGHDVRKQCEAAGCLCNLALADSKACNTIAKAAGPYLITALGSLTMELVVPCAWALGNLAGAGSGVGALLAAQGAAGGLRARRATRGGGGAAAGDALVQLARQLGDRLRVEHLRGLLEELMEVPLSMSSSQLLFILSCHANFPDNMTDHLPRKILDILPKTVEKHISTCRKDVRNDVCCQLTFLVRVLANIDVSKVYEMLIETLSDVNMTENVRKILCFENNSVLCKSLMWLLGNLYNYNGENAFFYTLLNSNVAAVQ